jgi:uncharacterized protein (DUF983 family)
LQNEDAINALEPSNDSIFNCPICFDPLKKGTATMCGHIFCKKCIRAAIKTQHKCPNCRKDVSKEDLRRVFLP